MRQIEHATPDPFHRFFQERHGRLLRAAKKVSHELSVRLLVVSEPAPSNAEIHVIPVAVEEFFDDLHQTGWGGKGTAGEGFWR
jgi:hypothetical protein